MPALNTQTTLDLASGTAGQIRIPLLPGSRYETDLNERPFDLASNLVAPNNAALGIMQPYVLAVCRPFDTWFGVTTIASMFRLSFGQFVGLGSLRFHVAGETLATQFAQCKVQTMRISWEQDQPLQCEILFYPFGFRGTVGTPKTAIPTGPAWGSHRTVVGGGLGSATGVAAGQVLLSNGLVPDLSSNVPLTGTLTGHYASIDNGLYPLDYYRSAMRAELTLVQQSTGKGYYNGLPGSRWNPIVTFQNMRATHNLKVYFQSLLEPKKTAAFDAAGIQYVARTYQSIAQNPFLNVVGFTGV